MVPGSPGCAEGSDHEFASCFGSGKNSSAGHLVFERLCWFGWSCFWCSPSQSSSVFLQIGQFGPHLHPSGFGVVALGFG